MLIIKSKATEKSSDSLAQHNKHKKNTPMKERVQMNLDLTMDETSKVNTPGINKRRLNFVQDKSGKLKVDGDTENAHITGMEIRNKSGFTKTTLYRDFSQSSPRKAHDRSFVASINDEKSQDPEITEESSNTRLT